MQAAIIQGGESGMDHLQRQYLRAAYGLAKANAMRMFSEDEVTNHVDLDPTEPNYTERFSAITADLIEMGFIESVSKGLGPGRRTLKLTSAGMEEAERLADPIVQRKELRALLLRTIYVLADGETSRFVSWEEVAPALGLDPTDAEQARKTDVLAEHLDRSGFVTIEVEEGGLYRITAAGIDEVEGNEPRAAAPSIVYNIGVAQGSIIGSQQNADLRTSFDFGSVSSEIESRGGEDAPALSQMMYELEGMLEGGQALPKGGLARYGELMGRNEWVIRHVVNVVMRFATAD